MSGWEENSNTLRKHSKTDLVAPGTISGPKSGQKTAILAQKDPHKSQKRAAHRMLQESRRNPGAGRKKERELRKEKGGGRLGCERERSETHTHTPASLEWARAVPCAVGRTIHVAVPVARPGQRSFSIFEPLLSRPWTVLWCPLFFTTPRSHGRALEVLQHGNYYYCTCSHGNKANPPKHLQLGEFFWWCVLLRMGTEVYRVMGIGRLVTKNDLVSDGDWRSREQWGPICFW